MKGNHITELEGLREEIRKIVSERFYSLMSESIFEASDDEESETNDSDNENDKPETKMEKQIAKQIKPQVIRSLEDPKINQAAIAYAIHPDQTKDGARSTLSKQINGKRPFTDDEVITAYQELTNRGVKLNENGRCLTTEELQSVYKKLHKEKAC